MTMPDLPETGDTDWRSDWAVAAHERLVGNMATTTPSARSIGTGATEAAAGNHTHSTTTATTSAAGIVELATNAETTTGTDTSRAVTPAGLKVELDKKQNLLITTSTKTTSSYTFALVDAGTLVEGNSGSAQTFTVPPNSSVAFTVGTSIAVRQYGAGQITISPGSGVTLRSRGGALKTAGQYAELVLTKRGTDEWVAAGDTTV